MTTTTISLQHPPSTLIPQQTLAQPPITLRVLDVFPHSPAAHAQLVPYEDYLIGTTQLGAFTTTLDLDKALALDTVQLVVLHEPTRRIRLVDAKPNPNWGGKGALGCDIGTGTTNQIPVKHGVVVTFKT